MLTVWTSLEESAKGVLQQVCILSRPKPRKVSQKNTRELKLVSSFDLLNALTHARPRPFNDMNEMFTVPLPPKLRCWLYLYRPSWDVDCTFTAPDEVLTVPLLPRMRCWLYLSRPEWGVSCTFNDSLEALTVMLSHAGPETKDDYIICSTCGVPLRTDQKEVEYHEWLRQHKVCTC